MPILKPLPGPLFARRLPAGCVGHWLFNEHHGDCIDLSGRRNDLTPSASVVRSSGDYGPEFGAFPGAHSLSIDHRPEFDLVSRPCITLLVKFGTTYADYDFIAAKTTGFWESGWGLMLWPSSPTTLAFFANFWGSQVANAPMPDPGYHAITGTYDPSSKVVQLWIDGSLRATNTQTHTLTDVVGPMRIGWTTFGGGCPFPIAAASISSGIWPDIPGLHADLLSGRFDPAAFSPWVWKSSPSIPPKLHHYKQMGAA